MAEKRIRYTDDGRPKACVVRIPAHLAQFLYRGVREGNFQDETALVTEIIRRWSEEQKPMDWPRLLGEIQSDEAEDEIREATRILMMKGPEALRLTPEETERIFVREPGSRDAEFVGIRISSLREILRAREKDGTDSIAKAPLVGGKPLPTRGAPAVNQSASPPE